MNSKICPGLLQEVLDFINCDLGSLFKINFCFVPGHVGIIGNEEADNLAKTFSNSVVIDMKLDSELFDTGLAVDKVLKVEWFKQIPTSSSGKLYLNEIHHHPVRSLTLKNCRRKDTFICRFRLLTVYLNAYKCKIGISDSAECSCCKVPETLHHWLLNCPSTSVLRQRLLDIAGNHILSIDLCSGQTKYMDCIYSWMLENNILL